MAVLDLQELSVEAFHSSPEVSCLSIFNCGPSNLTVFACS